MKNIILSSGKLDDLSLCKRKFQLSSVLNLCSKEIGERRDMDLGSLFHKAMEMHYTLKFDKVPLADIVKQTMEFVRFYSKTKMTLSDDDIQLIAIVYRDYALFYKNENYITDTLENKEPAIETPFAKVLYEDNDVRIIIEGIIDWLCSNTQSLEFVVDHKTTLGYFDPPMLSNQFFTYAWATGRKYVIVNKVQLKLEGAPEKRFTRIPYEINDRLIEEWVKDKIFYAKDILKREEENYYPADFTSCLRFIKHPCEFSKVCQSEPRYRGAIIEQGFRQKDPFNPMKDKESIRAFLEEMRK